MREGIKLSKRKRFVLEHVDLDVVLMLTELKIKTFKLPRAPICSNILVNSVPTPEFLPRNVE